MMVYLNIQIVLRQKLDTTRTQLMVSQIQPHFIFNTLATIEALCEIDSKEAVSTIQKFSRYLRGNIASLDGNFVVSFDKELEHVKIYIEIEQKRFDNFEVIYDIKERDFNIPFLSVQPLVENAIRHGIRIREEGIIKIESFRDEKYYYVVISDNGKGFDKNQIKHQLMTKDAGNHIGLSNVEYRIISLCNGTVDIESEIDKGSSITLKLPVKVNSNK